MSVCKYTCRQCQTFFELVSPKDSKKDEEAKCPACGSIDVEVLPQWIPYGFNLNLYHSQLTWQYSCHQCQTTFELPVPSGPTEEKQRKCPVCKSMDIERLTVLVVDLPVYCG